MNSSISNFVFIIPCYNEASRISIESYKESIKNNENLTIYFIDDGSSDDTLSLLGSLKELFPAQINIVSLSKNAGKAEAVRYGMQEAIKNENTFNYFGFLDADLATSLDEALRLSNVLKQNKLDMVFGSRISMVGSIISRNKYRHVVGRVIATFVSNILRLRVYDTQCGAKFFSRALATTIFNERFISKWLFDVEIFARILCNTDQFNENKILEVPLKNWIDKDGSKVELSYMFKLFFDLNKIRKAYPLLKNRSNLD